ncbi:MAG: hypothetical protein SVZ03_03130 [Spirochaetota bacterium]|nr:hypothetical protein [Spirochaetota bacterium]
MKKNFFALFILFIINSPLFGEEVKKTSSPGIPVQSLYSEKLKIKNISFNRLVDVQGKGETLEVEFLLKNLIDDPQYLYIVVVATFEKVEKTKSSFEMPIPPKKRIRSFVPYPDDISNYEYDNPQKEGEKRLIKMPKNPKAGINPNTGKPYHLVNQMIVRTYHLSNYRSNYFYFNEVAIIIFDAEGSLIYKQLYKISGVRR